MKNENSADPLIRISKVERKFTKLIEELRKDIPQMNEPQAKALFETSAEVIAALKNAFLDYENKNHSG